MRRLLLAAVFGWVLSPASAETLSLPSDYAELDQRAQFRLCRAAILVEDGAPEDSRSRLPPAAVSAMREQITFIMAETIFNAPAFNLEDGQKRAEFTEKFVIDFSRTIGAERERLDNIAEREAILMSCQPLIWAIMKDNIDVLMQWRLRAMGLDRAFPGDAGHSAAPAE